MEQSTCQHDWYSHDDYCTCLNCGLHATDARATGGLARQREQERRAACYPALVAAVEAIEAANGYGLDVPEHIDDDHDWLVTAGAIRKCAEAMRLVRGIEAEHDQVWRNETQQRLHDQVVADEAVRDEALRRARAEYIQAAAEEGEEDNADTDE